MADSIDRLNIEITSSTERAQQSISNLANNLGTLKSALDGISANSIRSMASSTRNVEHAMSRVHSSARRAASGLRDLSRHALSFGRSIARTSVHAFATGLRALGSAASHAAIGMAQLGKAVLTTPFKAATSLAQRFGKNVGSSVNEATASMKHGIGMLMRYGLGFRSLFYAYRRLRGAIKDAFTDLASVSAETNANLSLLSSSLSQLKFSLASAFDPILTYVTPVLNYLIQCLVAAMNAVAQFFAALTGQSTWKKATFQMASFAGGADNAAGSAGNAADAADKLKKSLMGFDEINKLDDANSSSGGGGGGGGDGGGGAGAGGFTTETIDTGISNFAQMVKDAWKAADFTDVGNLIGTKLAEALNNIPWDTVKKNAKKFGSSFATLLNGLLESKIDTVGDGKHWKTLGQILGKTLGEVVNTGLELWEGWVDKFHFNSFGAFIADGMNEMTITVDWEKLADNLAKTANGILDAADTWLNKFKFDALGEEIGKAVKRVLNKFANTGGWQKLKTNLKNLGKGLAKFVKGFFKSNPLTSVGNAIGEALDAVLIGSKSFLKNLPTKTIGEDLAGAMNKIFTKKKLWKDLASATVTAANSIFKLAATWSGKFKFAEMGNAIRTAITNTLDNLSWKDAKKAAKNIASGIADALNEIMKEDTFSAVGVAIGEGINTAVTGVHAFVTSIKWDDWAKALSKGVNDFFKTVDWEKLGITFSAVSESLAKGINAFFKTIKTVELNIKWDKFGQAIGNSINKFFKNIEWDTIGITFSNVVGGLLDGLKAAIETIEFDKVGSGLADAIANVNWQSLFDKAADLLQVTGNAFSAFLEGLLGGLGDALKTWFENNVPQDIIDFINNVIEAYRLLTETDWGFGNVDQTGNLGAQTIKEGGEARPTGTGTQTGTQTGTGTSAAQTHSNEVLSYLLGDGSGEVTVKLNAEKGTGFEYVEQYNEAQDGTATKTADGKETDEFKVVQKDWNTFPNGPSGHSSSSHKSTKIIAGKEDSTYKPIVKDWQEVPTTHTATKIIAGKQNSTYQPIVNDWEKVPTTHTATKKIAGEKANSYETIANDWQAVPTTHTATKILQGKEDETFKNRKKHWEEVPTRQTATKILEGKETESFANRKKHWDSIKEKATSLKTIVGKELESFTNRKKHWDSIPEKETSTKTLEGVETNNFKDSRVDWFSLKPKDTSTKVIKGDQEKSFTNAKNAINSIPSTTTSTIKMKAKRASGVLSLFAAFISAASGSWSSAKSNAESVPSEWRGGTFWGGSWHKIAQYAKGGLPDHGSVFIAGERGAETVGHIGGRTEVLNQSQMASVMYSAVVRGMIEALSVAGNSQEVHIHLDSDARKMFRVVQQEANNYTNSTGRPAFNM